MARFKIGRGTCSCPSWYAQHRTQCPLHPDYEKPDSGLKQLYAATDELNRLPEHVRRAVSTYLDSKTVGRTRWEDLSAFQKMEWLAAWQRNTPSGRAYVAQLNASVVVDVDREPLPPVDLLTLPERTTKQQIKDLRQLAKYATREADRLERGMTDSREQ
jgi:hypothetical protein